MLDVDAKQHQISAMPNILADGTLDVSKSVVLTEEQQQLTRLLVTVMERYDAVITATQGKQLSRDFEMIIAAFGSAYHRFCGEYFRWNPPSQSNKYRGYETPKVHIVLNELVEYLKLSGTGMSRLSEHTFEAVHSRYKTFVQQRRQPRPVSLVATQPRNQQRYSMIARARALPGVPAHTTTDTATLTPTQQPQRSEVERIL